MKSDMKVHLNTVLHADTKSLQLQSQLNGYIQYYKNLDKCKSSSCGAKSKLKISGTEFKDLYDLRYAKI